MKESEAIECDGECEVKSKWKTRKRTKKLREEKESLSSKTPLLGEMKPTSIHSLSSSSSSSSRTRQVQSLAYEEVFVDHTNRLCSGKLTCAPNSSLSALWTRSEVLFVLSGSFSFPIEGGSKRRTVVQGECVLVSRGREVSMISEEGFTAVFCSFSAE